LEICGHQLTPITEASTLVKIVATFDINAKSAPQSVINFLTRKTSHDMLVALRECSKDFPRSRCLQLVEEDITGLYSFIRDRLAQRAANMDGIPQQCFPEGFDDETPEGALQICDELAPKFAREREKWLEAESRQRRETDFKFASGLLRLDAVLLVWEQESRAQSLLQWRQCLRASIAESHSAVENPYSAIESMESIDTVDDYAVDEQLLADVVLSDKELAELERSLERPRHRGLCRNLLQDTPSDIDASFSSSYHDDGEDLSSLSSNSEHEQEQEQD